MPSSALSPPAVSPLRRRSVLGPPSLFLDKAPTAAPVNESASTSASPRHRPSAEAVDQDGLRKLRMLAANRKEVEVTLADLDFYYGLGKIARKSSLPLFY